LATKKCPASCTKTKIDKTAINISRSILLKKIFRSDKFISNLQFSNLSFAYPANDENALQDISFEIQAGQSLAVVGASGAGKSTLMNLLLRFWEYEQGEILLAGKSLHDLPEDWVRAQIAVIPQKAYFFNTSVRENLLLARPSASTAEMIASAKGAQIHDFIASLPDGYETLIGEQGFRLSGGRARRAHATGSSGASASRAVQPSSAMGERPRCTATM
jgi:ABC-type multidrug transport system fused ATPase/permease subunit